MNRIIYKYGVTIYGGSLELGARSKIISADNQNGILQVWAEIDIDEPQVRYVDIAACVTGSYAPNDDILGRWTFLSTVMFEKGEYVVHVYYRWRI